MTSTPHVAICILNWNGKPLLERYLPHLFTLDYPDYQIYVVDNGSDDNSVAYLHSLPAVHLILLKKNMGFGPAYNQAIPEIEADIYVLLNNDVEVRPDWLSRLVAPLINDAQIGVTGSKLYFGDGQTLQHAGADLQYPRANGRHRFYRETDVGQADKQCDVGYVTGAAMAIHRRVLADIGLFDPEFAPFYYEEVDFCRRTQQAGFRVVYVPDSVALHHESVSMRKNHAAMFHYLQRNRLYYILKHDTPAQFLDAFVPAEKAYLPNFTPEQRQIMHTVYLETALKLPPLQSRSNVNRTRPAYVSALFDLAETAVSPPPLPEPAPLQEFTFPTGAGLLRQVWFSVGGKWAARHLIQQQNQLNRHIFRQIKYLTAAEHTSAAETSLLTGELTRTNLRLAQTIETLTDEIDGLHARLEKLEAQKEAGE
ncbi:MAG: glycosyltransferase family 2 protein [Chloroflexi bacterium]|nr:glycosyltransferase family 2 protein [Chloroflexota bacterium]